MDPALLTSAQTSRQSTLLFTKLRPPALRGFVVPRQRLHARLDQGLSRPLTLISAPAGFGKTTLLGSWLANRGDVLFAWVTLDDADNDSARFWRYLVAALKEMLGTVDKEAASLLVSLVDTTALPPSDVLLPALINALAGSPADRNCVLVLDDYHLIREPAIHRAVASLLEYLPPQLHVMIAGRGDPPLPRARLAARDQLVRLDATDLRCTSAEAAGFLRDIMGLSLAPSEMAIIEARTEGWLAGLQLAALALHGCRDVRVLLDQFGGRHRLVADFLAEEVLQRQPGELATFLLHTSILDRLSGPLCAAVAGQPNAADQLERLERANLFLVPLDEERHWYRYHHLFAEFLRSRLERSEPTAIPDLHRRASTWYAAAGYADEAVGHALAAGDASLAVSLVESSGGPLLTRGEVVTLRRWLAGLPQDLVRTRPRLALYQAWTELIANRLEEADRWLREAEASAVPAARDAKSGVDSGETSLDVRRTLGEVAVIRGQIARLRGDLDAAIAYSREAVDLLADDQVSAILRGTVAWNLGAAYWLSGAPEAADAALAEATTFCRTAGNLHGAIQCLTHRGQLAVARGRLREAVGYFTQALQPGGGDTTTPAVAAAHVGLSHVLRERDELMTAELHLTQGLELARRQGDAAVVVLGMLELARLRCAQGDPDGALAALAETEAVVPATFPAELNAEVAALRARLLIAKGDLVGATRWVTERGLTTAPVNSISQRPYYLQEDERFVLARLRIAEGHAAEAALWLDQLVSLSAPRVGCSVEHLTLLAVAQSEAGRGADALTTLERALALGEPEGYVHVFLSEGPPLARLLRRAVGAGIGGTYARGLLAHWPAPAGAGQRGASTLLSEREREVLRLIAEGRSNSQIAAALIVSTGTVKTHVHNICTRLDVPNRTAAVARARALGLL